MRCVFHLGRKEMLGGISAKSSEESHNTPVILTENLKYRISSWVLENIKETARYYRDRKCRKLLLPLRVEEQKKIV